MRHPMKDLPLVEDHGEGFQGRQIGWAGMIVSYETFPSGVDAAPLFEGLPGNSCQSPHWGYSLKGLVRVKHSDGGELLPERVTSTTLSPAMYRCSRRTPRSSSSAPPRSTARRSRRWLATSPRCTPLSERLQPTARQRGWTPDDTSP
jgi:hypothetical protein